MPEIAVAAPPLPSLVTVAAAQLRSVGLAVRRELRIFAVGLLVLGALGVLGSLRAAADPDLQAHIPVDPQLAFPMVLLGLLAPLAVWKEMGPSRRGAHWAMPVPRLRHDLVRVAAGWVWYMAALLAFVAWNLAVAWLTGGIGHPNAVPQPAWWQWLVPFAGGTIAYLFGSAVALSTDHPWRWFAAFVLGMLLTSAIGSAAGWDGFLETLARVISGRWGLEAALSGTTAAPQPMTMPDGQVVMFPGSRPDAGAWIGATLLWLALGLGLNALAARRFREG